VSHDCDDAMGCKALCKCGHPCNLHYHECIAEGCDCYDFELPVYEVQARLPRSLVDAVSRKPKLDVEEVVIEDGMAWFLNKEGRAVVWMDEEDYDALRAQLSPPEPRDGD
jgi:hypothetical protein